MTVVWIILSFLAGMAFWHWCGAWLWKNFGLRDEHRRKILYDVSTDVLILLHRDSAAELERRRSALNEIGDA